MLVQNWPVVVKHAWSFRFIALSVGLGAAERIGGKVSQLAMRIDNIETFRVERTRQTVMKFEAIARSLEALPTLPIA